MASAVEWLKSECHLDDSGAEQIVEYIVAGRTVLGAVPTQTTLIAERFFDEGGGMQLVIHAPLGARDRTPAGELDPGEQPRQGYAEGQAEQGGSAGGLLGLQLLLRSRSLLRPGR